MTSKDQFSDRELGPDGVSLLDVTWALCIVVCRRVRAPGKTSIQEPFRIK